MHKFSKKSRIHLKILRPIGLTGGEFHIEDWQISGGTVQNLVPRNLCTLDTHTHTHTHTYIYIYTHTHTHIYKVKIKDKGHPTTGHEGPEGEYRYSSNLSLTSALAGVGGQSHAPAALAPGKTRYPLYRSLGGAQGQSVQVRKISPPPEFDPRTVRPVASRYTDWPTPDHSYIYILHYCVFVRTGRAKPD